MLLAGSGGIGKTQLVQQLALQAEQSDVAVLWGRCPEEVGAPAFWPWRQLIRGYLRGGAPDDAAALFGAGLADIAGIVPEVAGRFGVPAARAEANDSAQSRFRLFDAVAGFWRRAAQRSPLLLIFEDLHWADATSLRLFTFLAAEIDDCALLVVGTYRDTELSRQHPLFETLADLTRSPLCQRVELQGLSVRETEELAMAASCGAVSANFVSALHARTEGHPLYLVEMLRYLIGVRAPGNFAATGNEARLLTTLPTGVREVIGKRLNRLSEPAASLLSIAACIGRSFDLHLLAELEHPATEDTLLRSLEEALSEHLIEAVPESHAFRFGHALIRETLYDEMLPVRRSRLHLRIGELLEQRHGHDDVGVWPQLAYHFSEAGPGLAAARALTYARRAAEHAGQLLAFEEAARLYRLALQLLRRHFADDKAQRCDVLLALADAQTWCGVPETARAWYQQAGELARECGLTERFCKAAIGFSTSSMQAGQSGEAAVTMLLDAIALHEGKDATRVDLLSRLCVAYVYCDRADQALQAQRRAVELARRIEDKRCLYAALAAIATAGYWPELLHQRLSAADEAWTIAEDLDLPERIVSLLAFYLCDLIKVGDTATLARVREQGLRQCEQRHAYYWLSVCQQIEALVAVGEGRFDDAEVAAVRAPGIGAARRGRQGCRCLRHVDVLPAPRTGPTARSAADAAAVRPRNTADEPLETGTGAALCRTGHA